MSERHLEPKLTVARGYDKVAQAFLRQYRRELEGQIEAYLGRLTEGLVAGARILDLGCGAGVPYTASLSERFAVTGVDISRGQLALARRLAPRATFLRADMSALTFKPASFDAIVALYSIIHVPREEHEPLLRRLFNWLRPGKRLFVVLGSNDWEGREADWLDVPGAEMYWSHYGVDKSLEVVERAGFRLLDSHIEPDSLDGAHLFVLAEKHA